MTLADSGGSQCFANRSFVKEAQCCRVTVHTSSGDSRVVPDQGAVLEIKEALLSEFVFLLRAV